MKEFDLSSKRDETIKQYPFGKPNYMRGWNDAIKQCNQQDKEFIRLRYKIDNLLYFNEISCDEHERLCKKLAGEDLI